MNEDPKTSEGSAYGNRADESSKTEVLVLTMLFVGVVGLSFALVGLDVGVTPPVGEQDTQGKTESAQAAEALAVLDGAALSRAGAIPPATIMAKVSEALLEEILGGSSASADEESGEPADGEEPGEEAAPTLEEAASQDGTPSTQEDPYSDLVMVGDPETPIRDAEGEAVKLETPKTRVTTTPRRALPGANPKKESRERALKPAPKAERPPKPAAAPPAPAPKPAPSSTKAPAASRGAGAGDVKVLLKSARTKLRSGDPAGAASEYKKALAMKGGNGARLGLAKAHYEMGQTAKAKKQLKKVLASSPTSGGALLLMGSISQEQGDRGGARGYYQKYLDSHPTSRRAERIRGILMRL
jgi:tetratricopeptide (TPR) repeat protein